MATSAPEMKRIRLESEVRKKKTFKKCVDKVNMKLFETKKTTENDSSSSSEDDVEMILRDTDDDTPHQSEEVETNELT